LTRRSSTAWKRAAEKTAQLSTYGALEQVVAAVTQNKLPPTVLVPALKGTMSQADLQKEFGLTGTTNFRGDLLTESNAKLVHQLAFGQPGNRTWGEWEKILMTDPAVSTALEHVKIQIRDAEVDIKEPDVDLFKDRALAKKQTDFLRWNLLSAMEPGWTDVAQQMCNALAFGFSLHETVAAQCQHPALPGGTGYKLGKLAERLPVSIHPMGWIESPDTKDLMAVRQWGNEPGTGRWVEALLPADKLLLHSWGRRGNNYLGFPAFRSVWWWCKAREQIAKIVPIAMLREAAGVPIAYTDKADAALDTKSRQRLQRFLANMVLHENASAVLPAGWKLDWFSSKDSNKGHVLEVYNNIGTIILQQVMAQHLALGVHGNSGNRSLGESQSDVSDAFAAGVLAGIAGVLNGVGSRPYTGLAKKIIQWNWGPQPAYPTVSLTLKKAKLKAPDFASAVVALKGAGAITLWSHEDENDAREHMGLGPIDEDAFNEEKERKQDIAATIAANPPPQPPTAPGSPQANAKGGPAPKPGAVGLPPKSPAKLAADFAPRRPLRPSEQLLNLGDISAFFDSSKDDFERGARPLVAEMLAAALPDVKTALKDGDPAELANVDLDTGRLERFIKAFIDKARQEGFRQVAAEARKAGLAARLAAEEEKEDEQDAADELETLVASMEKATARKIENRLREQLEASAIDVQRTGGKPSEVVAQVLSDQTEGALLRNAAASITTKAFNIGREEFADQYGDAVESVELSSVLDTETCTYCEAMDGTEFDFQSDGHEENTPPLRGCDGRDNCRCLLVYNFK
jgi:hypothetical protein